MRKKRRGPIGGEAVTLATMKPGESGTVVDVGGGRRMVERLAALGIRPGKRVTKVSSMLLSGPVTVEVDRSQVAIGFHVASRIRVDVKAK
jgi:ferrous iron transport protein A